MTALTRAQPRRRLRAPRVDLGLGAVLALAWLSAIVATSITLAVVINLQ